MWICDLTSVNFNILKILCLSVFEHYGRVRITWLRLDITHESMRSGCSRYRRLLCNIFWICVLKWLIFHLKTYFCVIRISRWAWATLFRLVPFWGSIWYKILYGSGCGTQRSKHKHMQSRWYHMDFTALEMFFGKYPLLYLFADMEYVLYK